MSHIKTRDADRIMKTHIALFRGLNVGSANRLPMAALADIFTHVGCTRVQTYIQSGNVIYESPEAFAPSVPVRVADELAQRFGYKIPIRTRTTDELADAIASNPLAYPDVDEKALHVAFLADAPSLESLARLDEKVMAPEKLTARGRHLYLYLPNGVARTKLTNSFLDSTLATVSTLRNWRTALRLCEMALTHQQHAR